MSGCDREPLTTWIARSARSRRSEAGSTKELSLCPRPGSFEGQVPLIDWAVIQDPFGNEFCLVGGQSKDEIGAVVKSPSTE